MIGNRRGDIGFLEAMVSAMAVCLVLSVFLAALAADVLAEEDGDPPGFDWSITDRSEIHGGRVVSDIGERLPAIASREKLCGITVRCTPLADGAEPSEWSYGETGAERIVLSHMSQIPAEDGRIIPTLFEAVMSR